MVLYTKCCFVTGTSGQLRLTNGLAPQHGYLEVCANGAWNRVCGDNWFYSNSFVACRQLGYPSTDLGMPQIYPFGVKTVQAWSNSVLYPDLFFLIIP